MEIWTEKYRPKRLKEIVGQEEVTKKLESLVASKALPHMLFSGRAGIGKTCAALAIAREIYSDEWTHHVLELNASDERGIDVVRHKVKDFARTKAIGNFPYKLIYLDESDALTSEAQQALRRTMENYSGTCRFILSCNYSSKIIDPIQSRCSIFRFRPLKAGDVKARLKSISKAEKISADDKALDAIILLSEGDMRRAINLLQAAVTNKKITEAHVFEVSSRAKPEDIKEILELAMSGRYLDARGRLEDLQITQGLSGLDMIKQIHSVLLKLDIPDKRKISLLDRVGEYEFRMVEGGDERIQLDALLAQFLE